MGLSQPDDIVHLKFYQQRKRPSGRVAALYRGGFKAPG